MRREKIIILDAQVSNNGNAAWFGRNPFIIEDELQDITSFLRSYFERCFLEGQTEDEIRNQFFSKQLVPHTGEHPLTEFPISPETIAEINNFAGGSDDIALYIFC